VGRVRKQRQAVCDVTSGCFDGHEHQGNDHRASNCLRRTRPVMMVMATRMTVIIIMIVIVRVIGVVLHALSV
jgi:hypothetical protein